jgi:hypothetical protein
MSVFRVYAHRSLVTANTDGDIAMYNGYRKMIQWYKNQTAMERIIAKNDVAAVAKLAKETGSDYIILPRNMSAVPGWKPVYKDSYWTVYAPI